MEDGLLLADIDLTYKGLIDTGSAGTVISSDRAEFIGIIPEENDVIYRISGVGGSEFVFSKVIDSIRIGSSEAKDFHTEVGAMNYGFDLDGIIGLDLLMHMKATIHLDKLTIDFSC